MIPNTPQIHPKPKAAPSMTDLEYEDAMKNAPDEPMTSETLEEMYQEHLKSQRHEEVHGKKAKKSKKSRGPWPGNHPSPF